MQNQSTTIVQLTKMLSSLKSQMRRDISPEAYAEVSKSYEAIKIAIAAVGAVANTEGEL